MAHHGARHLAGCSVLVRHAEQDRVHPVERKGAGRGGQMTRSPQPGLLSTRVEASSTTCSSLPNESGAGEGLAVTTMQELLDSVIKLRAAHLSKGIEKLLGTENAERFFTH